MRVYLGSDHAGFELKVHLANHLAKRGYELVDVGPHAFDPDDDYPAFCLHTTEVILAIHGAAGGGIAPPLRTTFEPIPPMAWARD